MNFKVFQKNTKSETLISVAYGTEFVSSKTIVFYLVCMFVACVCIYCHILRTNPRQIFFFMFIKILAGFRTDIA